MEEVSMNNYVEFNSFPCSNQSTHPKSYFMGEPFLSFSFFDKGKPEKQAKETLTLTTIQL